MPRKMTLTVCRTGPRDGLCTLAGLAAQLGRLDNVVGRNCEEVVKGLISSDLAAGLHGDGHEVAGVKARRRRWRAGSLLRCAGQRHGVG